MLDAVAKVYHRLCDELMPGNVLIELLLRVLDEAEKLVKCARLL